MTQRENKYMEKAKAILEKVDLLVEKLSIELGEYKKIGTPEKCRKAMEKQAEKKVLRNEKAKRYFCPACKRKCNYMHSLYCSGCGQKLDWSDEE